jgi:hypothetical protein
MVERVKIPAIPFDLQFDSVSKIKLNMQGFADDTLNVPEGSNPMETRYSRWFVTRVAIWLVKLGCSFWNFFRPRNLGCTRCNRCFIVHSSTLHEPVWSDILLAIATKNIYRRLSFSLVRHNYCTVNLERRQHLKRTHNGTKNWTRLTFHVFINIYLLIYSAL